jgi:hypothetical protein
MPIKAGFGPRKVMIKKYKNILPIEDFDVLWDTIIKTPWVFGHRSYENSIPFFCQNISTDYIFLEPFYTLCRKVKSLIEVDINQELYPIWIKTNGQVFGQDGAFHKDLTEDGFYTFVFFPMPTWDTSWGGEFIVFDDNSKEYTYSPPLPNTGIFFPSNFDHVGAGPKREFKGIRVSVALNFCVKENIKLLSDYERKVIEL